MRALVVYESMYGNTKAVAEAIGQGLGHLETSVVEVGSAPERLDDGLDLLVAGAPTHAWGLSRPATRASAADQVAEEPGRTLVSTGPGLREWLGRVTVPAGLAVAAFDTRIKVRFLPGGSAARAVARRLRRSGCQPVAGPQTFWVAGTAGPLRPGEIERARGWGARIAADLAQRLTPGRP